jgi:hypothetical protein
MAKADSDAAWEGRGSSLGWRHRPLVRTRPVPGTGPVQLGQVEIQGVQQLDGRVRRVHLHVFRNVEQGF